MSDLKNHLAPAETLAPTNQADPATPVNGTGVDLANYDAAVVLLHVGAMTGAGGSQTFQVQESTDNAAFTAVAAADLDGGQPAAITATNDSAVYEIGYRGTARYLRVSITAKAGTSPTMVSSAVVVRGKARKLPA